MRAPAAPPGHPSSPSPSPLEGPAADSAGKEPAADGPPARSRRSRPCRACVGGLATRRHGGASGAPAVDGLAVRGARPAPRARFAPPRKGNSAGRPVSHGREMLLASCPGPGVALATKAQYQRSTDSCVRVVVRAAVCPAVAASWFPHSAATDRGGLKRQANKLRAQMGRFLGALQQMGPQSTSRCAEPPRCAPPRVPGRRAARARRSGCSALTAALSLPAR